MSEPVTPSSADPPAASIVLPTCNRGGALARCLDALAAQTHDSFEIIVVDDGSTDGTPQRLEAFKADHPALDLRWIVNETNVGATVSRNRGVLAARGRIVAFIDSDAIAPPDWLACLHAALDEHDADVVAGLVVEPEATNVFELVMKGSGRVTDGPVPRRLIAGNMALRREVALRFPFEEDIRIYAEEDALQLRLRAAGMRLRSAPEAIVRHEHPYTARSYFRRAWLGGAGAAWLVRKFRLPPRLDLLPFLLAWLTLPLVLVRWWLAAVPALFFVAAIAAITWNELHMKRKTVGETLRVLPVLLPFYHVRLAGHAWQFLRYWTGRDRVDRVDLAAGDPSPPLH